MRCKTVIEESRGVSDEGFLSSLKHIMVAVVVHNI